MQLHLQAYSEAALTLWGQPIYTLHVGWLVTVMRETQMYIMRSFSFTDQQTIPAELHVIRDVIGPLTGIKLQAAMAAHVTKARGGSAITSLVDGCRQNLDKRKIAQRHGFNQRPHIRETDQLPLRYETSCEL